MRPGRRNARAKYMPYFDYHRAAQALNRRSRFMPSAHVYVANATAAISPLLRRYFMKSITTLFHDFRPRSSLNAAASLPSATAAGGLTSVYVIKSPPGQMTLAGDIAVLANLNDKSAHPRRY